MQKSAKVAEGLWTWARTHLPENLDEIARETGAAVRMRGFGGAEQMLRSFLIYAGSNSFRVAAELARSSGLADVTAEAIFFRLKNADAFLERVLLGLVGRFNAPVGFRLLLVDATVVCGPGSKGTDWRVHVGYDPVRGVPCSVELTDAHGGESLKRHPLAPGVLAVADSGYGTARNIYAGISSGADLLVRISQRNVRLLDESGKAADWTRLGEQVPEAGPASFDLSLPVPPDGAGSGWRTEQAISVCPVRLIGARCRDGKILWLLTNLSREKLGDGQACELYRTRWQVELYFKRLKSLGDLDVIKSREGPTAKAALLAKLILLVLTSLLSDEEQAFSPYGYKIAAEGKEPVARVRLRAQKASRVPASERARKWKAQ